MKTKRFSRKSIVFLFAIAVFFCSVQSPSFAQVELVAESLTRLTEATLHNSTVILALGGAEFEDNVERYLAVSGISGVSIDNVKLLDNTEIRVRLKFNGDFDQDDTLTFTVRSSGIKNYNGSDLSDEIPVPATTESLTATPTPTPLTEATLNNSTVTLTLRGRTFADNVGVEGYDGYWASRNALRVSGISGVTVPFGNIQRLSNTQITVPLQFNGSFDSDRTLTFTVRSAGIKNYHGSDLTDEIRVTATTESLTAIPSVPLTETTLNNSTVTLTLHGRTFENSIRSYVSVSGISGVNVPNVRLITGVTVSNIQRLNDTQITVPLQFNGSFDSDRTLTFTVRSSGIKNYNGSDLTTTLPVSAVAETQPPVVVAETPVNTQQPTVAPTPQPTVVRIPDPNLRAAIQQEIGNTITTQTMLNLTFLDASDLGIKDLTGLEHAANLSALYLFDNNISDVSPLAGLTQLTELDLWDNNISDISALIGLTQLGLLSLPENPLNDAALNTHIPAIEANGTDVEFDNRTPTTPTPPSVVGTPVTIPPNVVTTGSHPPIYWVDSDAGSIYHFDGSNVRDIVTEWDVVLWDIALDVAGGKMYWTNLDKIQCADLDGSNVRDIVTGLDQIASLALDVAGGKIYWTSAKWNFTKETFDPGKIQCADLDGSNVRDIATGLDQIASLALDVAGGKMYWTIPNEGKIQRANLDGSNVRDIVTGLRGPWDIALDISGGKMYWTMPDQGKIQRANLDGSNVRDIVTDRYFPEYIALDVAGGKMYWIDDGEIHYAGLDGSNVQDLVTGLPYPTGIALGIPPQTTGTSPKKGTQVHVDATDRPSMYWIDNDTLYRLTGANAQPIAERVNDVVVDTAGGKIYWTEKTGGASGKIHSANLDGSGAQVLKELTSLPYGLAVDSANGKLYLTNSRSKIRQMNVDGTQFKPNFIQDLDDPLNIAVSSGRVYWTEAGGNVRVANLEGNPKVVRDIATGTGALGGIAVGGNKVYWTEQTGEATGRIRSANLNGNPGVTEVITVTAVPRGIAVDVADGKIFWADTEGRIQRIRIDNRKRVDVVTGLIAPGALALGVENAADAAPSETTTRERADTSPYDVNGDGTVDSRDSDALILAVAAGITDTKYDVNEDGKVDIHDIVAVNANRDDKAAGAPTVVRTRLTAVQVDNIQEQIDLLLATNDRSPAALYTLQYLQNLIAVARPAETQLLANYPNPFNPETWIPYQLATGSDVRITIYDMSGKVIRRLVLGYQSVGYYTSRSRAAYWDGRNAVGEPVASGIYFYTFIAGDFTTTRKLLIRK